MFSVLLKMHIRQAFIQRGGTWEVLCFYLLSNLLFIFAVGVEAFAEHAQSFFCLNLSLAILLSIPLFFEKDYEDGFLEQYKLLALSFEWVIAAKLMAIVISVCLPLFIATGFISLSLAIPVPVFLKCLATLMVYLPCLLAIILIGASVSLSQGSQGHLLQGIIVLPLLIPALICCSEINSWHMLKWLASYGFILLPLSMVVSSYLLKYES